MAILVKCWALHNLLIIQDKLLKQHVIQASDSIENRSSLIVYNKSKLKELIRLGHINCNFYALTEITSLN